MQLLEKQNLIKKYFPAMEAGREYRPITDKELKRTTVYALEIESWSGKENWKDHTDQGMNGLRWMRSGLSERLV